jgi:phage gp36-like protein
MSAYVTQTQISDAIAGPDLISALDDQDNADGFITGSLNTIRLARIISTSCAEVDSFLAATYSTPFPDNAVPELVSTAALYITLSNIYKRRRSPPEAEQFVAMADSYREKLKEYATIPQSVGVPFPRAFPPGAISTYPMAWDMNTA